MKKKPEPIIIEMNDPELGNIVLDGSKEAEEELDKRVNQHYPNLHDKDEIDKNSAAEIVPLTEEAESKSKA